MEIRESLVANRELVSIVTLPAIPSAPAETILEIVPSSRLTCSVALISTIPALPSPAVEEEITAPLRTITEVALMVTLRASPTAPETT